MKANLRKAWVFAYGLGFLIAVGIALFTLLAALASRRSESPFSEGLSLLPVIVLVMGYVVTWRFVYRLRADDASQSRRAVASRIRLIGIAGALCAIGTSLLVIGAISIGRQEAEAITEGGPVAGGWSWLLPVRSECVTAEWEAGSSRRGVEDFIYLGHGDGVSVLYENSRGPLRVPTGSVVLSARDCQ